ncbi:MAG: hypothetical protein OEM58_05195 [Nitrospirota bacterium]|nr:hypothetical protein [Nitrospirota bacterium]
MVGHHGARRGSKNARDRFARLSDESQGQVVNFLQTLVLFSLDDTASHLNPGDSQTQKFPQYGHGNIALPALFNNPSDLE